jgi:hypothetical protein
MTRPDLPAAPEPPLPDRFQFSLGSMLVAMVASAVVMGVVAQNKLIEPPWTPEAGRHPAPRIVYFALMTMLVGLMLYLTIRLPYLWTFLHRRWVYSRQLAVHRRRLLAWAEETKAARRKEREDANPAG